MAARAPAVPVALLALLTGFALALPAFASAGAGATGLPQEGGSFGLSGYLAVQRLDLEALNAQLGQVPPLPAMGWAAGYGVLVVPPSGWGFASSSVSFRWEGRGEGGVSRLQVAHVQLGLVRRLLQGRSAALTAALMAGLATAELELVDGQPPSRPDDFKMNRFTRRLLTLEPQLGLLWQVSRAAFLHVSVGYLVGTDFWHSGWAHPYGTTLPGVPALLHGPGARLALVVGGS